MSKIRINESESVGRWAGMESPGWQLSVFGGSTILIVRAAGSPGLTLQGDDAPVVARWYAIRDAVYGDALAPTADEVRDAIARCRAELDELDAEAEKVAPTTDT